MIGMPQRCLYQFLGLRRYSVFLDISNQSKRGAWDQREQLMLGGGVACPDQKWKLALRGMRAELLELMERPAQLLE